MNMAVWGMAAMPSTTTIRAWARLIRTHQAVLGAVERDLKDAGFPPLAWYDVLLELTRAEGGRLRPFEIEGHTLLTQYNLSRLLDRLEAEKLVKRERCEADRRGQWIAITPAGRDLQARMWKVYGRAIQRHVGDKLDEKSARALADLLRRLLPAPDRS
jgi:DNA-binding MarR family transcriptional regulator